MSSSKEFSKLKSITMNDVAQAAGVSTTTVSHVINKTRKVEEATIAKVLHVMEDLGYRPNILARSLRRGETNTIGMIVPDVSNQFFADISRHIENFSYTQDYSVILCNSDNDMEKQASYVNTLLAKQVDGVIFISAGEPSEDLSKLVVRGIPVVVVDREVALEYADVVLLDNEAAGYQATNHLIRLGHKRIACITGPNDLTPSMLRVEGYKKALSEARILIKPSYILAGDFLFKGGENAMSNLLELDPRPSAVFVLNDMMAIGAITAIRKAGLNVPHDLSVIGFDDIEMAAAVTPALTTIAQPIEDIARISSSLLIEKIKSKIQSAENQRIVLEAELIVRESTQTWSAKDD